MSSLVEAKNMYMRKLVQILSPQVYSGFKTMYTSIEAYCEQYELKEVVSYFQKELEKIPKWPRDRITEETMKIQSQSDCDYLLDIITALLVVNMRILTDNDQVDLEIPQLHQFVHKCYRLIGSELWSNPELMSNQGTSSDKQRNYTHVIKLIRQGINDAIQFYLPMKPILNRYLRTKEVEQEEDDNLSITSSDDSEEQEDDNSMHVEVSSNEQEPSTFFDDADDIGVEDE